MTGGDAAVDGQELVAPVPCSRDEEACVPLRTSVYVFVKSVAHKRAIARQSPSVGEVGAIVELHRVGRPVGAVHSDLAFGVTHRGRAGGDGAKGDV